MKKDLKNEAETRPAHPRMSIFLDKTTIPVLEYYPLPSYCDNFLRTFYSTMRKSSCFRLLVLPENFYRVDAIMQLTVSALSALCKGIIDPSLLKSFFICFVNNLTHIFSSNLVTVLSSQFPLMFPPEACSLETFPFFAYKITDT